ncbi:hypothetical protein PJM50_29535, partial [Mycobacterium kansasii]
PVRAGSYAIFPIPTDATVRDALHPAERIEARGTADRLAVVLTRSEPDGSLGQYLVGRSEESMEASTGSELIGGGAEPLLVAPHEVHTTESTE